MDLTPHFPLQELVKTGGHTSSDGSPIDNSPPVALAGNALRVAHKLEQARAIWSKLLGRECHVRISYSYRCKALNDAVGSQDTSAHRLFLAADAIPEGMELRAAWDALVADPDFMVDVDQLIIERGCIHMGLAVPAHGNVPRHELRLDAGPVDHRTYPLFGHWTPQGVVHA